MKYFFFQAEDGIRDYKVTGVQTCALPIYILAAAIREGYRRARERHGDPAAGSWRWDRVHHANIYHRSEERRVGKEWKDKGVTCEEKKRKTRKREATRERTLNN